MIYIPKQEILTDNINEVYLLPNSYSYGISKKGSITIRSDHNPKKDLVKNLKNSKDWSPTFRKGTLADTEMTPLSDNELLVQKIDGCTIAYSIYYGNNDTMSNYGKPIVYRFQTSIDGLYIIVDLSLYSESDCITLTEALADPDNALIAPFFTEGDERTKAFRNLVNAVESRPFAGKKK